MISIVIPSYNNENVIANTIQNLRENSYVGLLKEIIVVDGGSTDNTVAEAQTAGATVIHSIRKNRAALFNLGAEQASGKIIYFLTPGSIAPKHFTNEIIRAIQKGCYAGVFRVKYEYTHWMLRAISYISRIKKNFASIDDQGLFVMKELFLKTGTFKEDLLILEDLEIMQRLRRYSKFEVLSSTVVSTTLKYSGITLLRKTVARIVAQVFFLSGYSQKKLLKIYDAVAGNKIPTKPQSTEVLSTATN